MLNYKGLLTMLSMLLGCVCTQAATLSVLPIAQNGAVGSLVNIDVMVSGLGAATAPSLGVFDFDLGFDDLRLSFQGVTFGGGLDVLGLGSMQTATLGSGTLNLFELSLDLASDLNTLQPDSFVLATITFLATGIGDAPFTLSVNALGDADGSNLPVTLDPPAGVMVLAAVPATVPEPASYALVAFGLIGIIAARRKSKALAMPIRVPAATLRRPQ